MILLLSCAFFLDLVFFVFTLVNFYLNVTAKCFGVPLALAKGYKMKSEWTDWKFKLFIGMFIHSSCRVVFFTASARVSSSMTLSDHSFVSPCLLILLDPSVCMYFLLYGTVCERAKVVTARSDGYQGWLCTAAYVQCSACAGILTLACWHGATPGAIAGAGPRDSLVPPDHHVARLAHECHILAHCGVIPNSETVGWNARVTTGDHCQWWSNTRNLHQTLF